MTDQELQRLAHRMAARAVRDSALRQGTSSAAEYDELSFRDQQYVQSSLSVIVRHHEQRGTA